jgi:(+)-trans-carveol dehydrogenase
MGILDGKVALISGAGRGQGRSHALTLAAQGADVIVFDVCKQLPTIKIPMSTRGDLDDTAALVEKTGQDVLAMEADVRDTASLDRVVQEGLKQFGHIDIVIANAGVLSFAAGHLMDDETWEQMIAVNLTGVWKTCRAALPSMIERGKGGAIVLTSSSAGIKPYTNQIHYVAAKHGVIGITKSFALELIPHNIRVNAVAPATVDSPLVRNPVVYELFTGKPDASEDDYVPAFTSLNAMPKPWNDVTDVSNAVLFLVSDAARNITGHVLPIDLGLLIKNN